MYFKVNLLLVLSRFLHFQTLKTTTLNLTSLFPIQFWFVFFQKIHYSVWKLDLTKKKQNVKSVFNPRSFLFETFLYNYLPLLYTLLYQGRLITKLNIGLNSSFWVNEQTNYIDTQITFLHLRFKFINEENRDITNYTCCFQWDLE